MKTPTGIGIAQVDCLNLRSVLTRDNLFSREPTNNACDDRKLERVHSDPSSEFSRTRRVSPWGGQDPVPTVHPEEALLESRGETHC